MPVPTPQTSPLLNIQPCSAVTHLLSPSRRPGQVLISGHYPTFLQGKGLQGQALNGGGRGRLSLRGEGKIHDGTSVMEGGSPESRTGCTVLPPSPLPFTLKVWEVGFASEDQATALFCLWGTGPLGCI